MVPEDCPTSYSLAVCRIPHSEKNYARSADCQKDRGDNSGSGSYKDGAEEKRTDIVSAYSPWLPKNVYYLGA